MVSYVRRGGSLRAAARRFACSVRTVWLWVQRAQGRRLDRVDWTDRESGPLRPHNRTTAAVQRLIVRARVRLQRRDALGLCGARRIRAWLQAHARVPVPSVRTIERILARHGLLTPPRVRRPPPPAGWYLPLVAAGTAELEQWDLVEGLRLQGRGAVEVLTCISLWGKLVTAVPGPEPWRLPTLLPTVAQHWQQWGHPDFVQVDNDTRFAGSSRAPRRLGRFVRACLAAGVVPVFTPPRETGFQARIENFNGLWQRKVWQRFRHRRWADLHRRNRAFVAAHRAYHARSQETAPPRPAHRAAADTIIFLRRLDSNGRAYLLGERVLVQARWAHRLVRCELNVSTHALRCFALRRREPEHQPLLCMRRFRLR